tara:strand:- start:405 stop:632 length:228 start_codon:yes stop_codon:yes gene_type:complete
METGDMVIFVEKPHPLDCGEGPTKFAYAHDQCGLLVEMVYVSISDDWGALWRVLLDDGSLALCYEYWMENINESR